MEYIKSKDIFLLMRDVLKLIHPRPMEHGSRVAYIVYKMLEGQEKYEEFELADIVMVATLHDIGAYKTEQGKLNDNLRFETRESMAHSIYGYLFFKYLSPVPDLSRVIMYHHMDYEKLQSVDYPYKELADYLNIAEKVDLYSTSMGDKFDLRVLQKQAGTKLSGTALNRFYQCENKYGIMDKIRSEEYKQELDYIADFMIYNNEEKKKFFEMLMYCMGFANESMVLDTITTVCICEELADRMLLEPVEKEILYYGALIHDIGMLAIPREIVDAPRKLTQEEMHLVRTHVKIADDVLSKRLHEEVLSIILAHHERGDGNGYPLRMKDHQMNRQQRILQVADVVSAMVNKRSYRAPLPKERIISTLNAEVSKNKLSGHVVKPLVGAFDAIMEHVRQESAEILKMYQNLNIQYEQVSKKYKI